MSIKFYSKKIFLTAALIITSAATGYSVPAEVPVNEEVIEVTEIVVPEQNIINTDNAVSEKPQVHESEIAKKMTQAEKAENARVNDSWGGAITIIAMCIVIGALLVLSILFLGFGKVSEMALTHRKRKAKAEAQHEPEDYHEVDSGEVIAAIAMALAEHFDDKHDMEDTILTIRRMKKAYSPWNSKIYNMRNMPEHVRAIPQRSAFSSKLNS